jgi:hypothetical protein
MRGKILSLGLSAMMMTVIPAQAQNWTRLPLPEGGVAENVNLILNADNTLGDTVWCANMDPTLFRSTWSSGSWGSWTEHQPGRGMLGVDAIRIGDTEYVLAATSRAGVRYKENPTGYGDWDYANYEYYPTTWHWVRTHDAAFCCSTRSGLIFRPRSSIWLYHF